MSELEEFDLDRAVKRAWATFQTRLADHVADMADGDILIVELGGAEDANGAAPYVQFKAWGGGLVRCEVSSNTYLDPLFALDRATEQVLTELGWDAPTYGRGDEPDSGSNNFHLDLERSYADRLAAMTVRAFRDVWSVPHPAFLIADALVDALPTDLGVAGQAQVVPPPGMVVSYPQDAEDLQRLVDETLTPIFGHPPEKDDDGDIPVRSGSALVFVRVRRDTPVVEVFAPLVRDISGRTRAAEVVADLNRRSLFIRFVLLDDAVMAVISLPAMPFVAAHLRDMLALMSETADDIDEELAVRLGGRSRRGDRRRDAAGTSTGAAHAAPPRRGRHRFPRRRHGGQGVRPRPGHDPVLPQDQLAAGDRLASGGRHRAAAGDRQEAAASNHEASAWEQTVETLRGALRLVVTETPPGRSGRSGWTHQQTLFPDPNRPTLFDDNQE